MYLENNIENSAWDLEHNAEKLQQIWNNAKNYEHNYLSYTKTGH